MAKIVIGLGFGDEGKGTTTSYLCSTVKRPIVVRFNGGHQAGHTVVVNGKRHIFSSFGAGTLQGVPTFWSKYCTFFPTAVINEYHVLIDNGVDPDTIKLIVDPLCPVTTPYDLESNRATEKKQLHGSVGVGFGATIQRQESFYKLFVQDLFYPTIVKAKLANIAKYYGFELPESRIDLFMEDIEDLKKIISVAGDYILTYYTPIFEGAQGVLLDQDFGFFPNVTRSNTTTKNAFEIIKSIGEDETMVEIYYVTRTYQTRHGNGFMTNEDPSLPLINNENETNKPHEFQGNFRVGKLDTDLLNYAIECDQNYSSCTVKKNLVVTCMDQHPIDLKDLVEEKLSIRFDKVLVSNGPSISDITEADYKFVEPSFQLD